MKGRRWATALVLLLALAPAAGLSWRALAAGGSTEPVALADQGHPPDRPNSRFFADGAQFAVECGLVRQAEVDPIVHPGDDAAGHLHDFFGSHAVGPDTGGADLVGSRTSCRAPADTASYWAPALLVDGSVVRPTAVIAYYRVAPGVEPREVEPFPLGLAAVAGRADGAAPQDPSVAGFGCGRATVVAAVPPACPDQSPLNLRITFPDCWDGQRLDSPDHRAHLHYSGADGCPPSHAVALPRLTLVVHYPVSGTIDHATLSSGPPESAHADFLNGWDPDALAKEVRSCLAREVVCAIPDPDRPGS